MILTRKKYFQFTKLGIFNFKNLQSKKYFEIFFRIIYIEAEFISNISQNKSNENTCNHDDYKQTNNDFQFDFLFYDVSDMILSNNLLFEENNSRKKVFAKIAHEFKTPINSIIGLIHSVKDNFYNSNLSFYDKEKSLLNDNINCYNNKKNNSKEFPVHGTSKNVSYNMTINYCNQNYHLDSDRKNNDIKKNNIDYIHNNNLLNIIENLSKYVIFLISDIIHFSNLNYINQIKTKKDNILLKDFSFFVFEILNCLLKCNHAKDKSVKTELFIAEQLNDASFVSDEIRQKQILLNIISNSVKFTKHGKIKLKLILIQETNELQIIVSDTGIGIKDEDKEKLFKDFVMLDSGSYQNPQGSGLGLSICKSLAYKLNIKLDFKSEYGKGSKFYIYIPIEIENIPRKKLISRNYISLENKNIEKLRKILIQKTNSIYNKNSKEYFLSMKNKKLGMSMNVQKPYNYMFSPRILSKKKVYIIFF